MRFNLRCGAVQRLSDYKFPKLKILQESEVTVNMIQK